MQVCDPQKEDKTGMQVCDPRRRCMQVCYLRRGPCHAG